MSPDPRFRTVVDRDLKSVALRAVAVSAIAILSVSCTTIRHGGAPEPSFDIDRDLEQLAEQFKPSDSITEFYKNPSPEARDKFVAGRLTLTNIRYIQFVDAPLDAGHAACG